VTGFHRREPAPRPVHRCAARANDCGPRTHASGVTVQSRPRFRIDGTRRIHEYDGARHREADVREVDLERDRDLLGARWERHGFTSTHLRRDGATIIADADRLLGRAWNPRRLAAWQGMIDHSLLGRAGRARAYRNWRRALAENRSDATRRRPQSGWYVTGS
jgi:hypothetical protein